MAAKMEHDAKSSKARFSEYINSLSSVLGRDDRVQPLKDYCIVAREEPISRHAGMIF
jgi:SRSO17 transposase